MKYTIEQYKLTEKDISKIMKDIRDDFYGRIKEYESSILRRRIKKIIKDNITPLYDLQELGSKKQ